MDDYISRPRLSEERIEEMIALRESGKTYREIGEKFGVSLQSVQQVISRSGCGQLRTRKASVDIEKIVYEGIYNLFMSDYGMTFTKFARIALGRRGVSHAEMERIRRLCQDYSDVRLSVQNIVNICEYIGKPFECVFKIRERREESDVVEVHCADCENWGGVTLGNTCRHWSTMDCRVCTKPTDFCSYGKRREQT